MNAKWTILCVAAVTSACASLGQHQRALLVPDGFGVETNRPITLTISQRERAYCIDAQPLVCESESGRLGPFRCVCPLALTGGDSKVGR